MNKRSLKFKIPFFVMVFAIACVLLTGMLSQYIATQNIEVNVVNKNLVISRMISQQIHIYLENAKSTVITAANFSSQSYGDLEEVKREIFRIYDNFTYFDLIFYMSNESQMVFSKPANDHVKSRSYEDRSYYWDIMDGKEVTVSPLLVSSVLNEPHFIIAAPVYNSKNEIIGLIGAGLPLKNIIQIVQRTQAHFNGIIWVADAQGVMAIHPDITSSNDLIMIPNSHVQVEEEVTDFINILRNKRDVMASYKVEDEIYYGAISFVPDEDWMVVVEQHQDTVFLAVIQLKRQLKLVIMAVIFIALLSGFILAKQITNPIEMLVNKVRQLSYGLRGEIAEDLKMQVKDEIGELEGAFHGMTIQLNESFNKLNQSYIRENHLQQYLNNILGSVANGIVVINQEYLITIYNKEAENLLEFPQNTFLRRHIKVFLDSIGVDLGSIIEDVMINNKVVKDIEMTAKGLSGRRMIISFTVSCVLDKMNNIIGVVLLFKDLTKIKMIELELRREDRIRTLGELSASIIHDIGNPLAGMRNLMEILRDDSYDAVSKNEVLITLQEEIEDLNKLVIHYLDFSRASILTKEIINIADLIDNIVYLFTAKASEKAIQIKKNYEHRCISLKGDRRALKQVFINIFKNAIEAVKEGGNVSISIQGKEKSVLISIQDNGIGIDGQSLDKIFYPFYTTKKDGNGLGLSIAYKIIKEHDGLVNVDSNEGVGTKISVELPTDV